jgi:NAD(P)-dependent dehydrogenase (short-subunit alcohol dehydrogenase family)
MIFFPQSALNAATKSLSVDLSALGILVMSLHPGWVKTDMGGYKAPITVEQSTQQIVKLLCSLSEKHNGQFYNYDGTQLPW